MRTVNEMSFVEMEREVQRMRTLYIKAKIRQTIGLEEGAYVSFQDSYHEGDERKVKAENYILAVEQAIGTIPDYLQEVLKKEITETRNYSRFWYLASYSRSTYYRYRREAYRLFLECFE